MYRLCLGGTNKGGTASAAWAGAQSGAMGQGWFGAIFGAAAGGYAAYRSESEPSTVEQAAEQRRQQLKRDKKFAATQTDAALLRQEGVTKYAVMGLGGLLLLGGATVWLLRRNRK